MLSKFLSKTSKPLLKILPNSLFTKTKIFKMKERHKYDKQNKKSNQMTKLLISINQ